MTSGFDLWRAIDAEGGARENQWADGYNAGLGQASMHVERLGYFEGDIVLPKATVAALLEAAQLALKALIGTDMLLHRHGMMVGIECPAIAPLRAAISLAGEG